jgi:Ca2+/H+ antiporter
MIMNSQKKFVFLFSWILFCIMLLLTPMPFSNESEKITIIDKIVHAFIFGVLALSTFHNLNEEHDKLIINPDKSQKANKNKRIADSPKNKTLSKYLLTLVLVSAFSYFLEKTQAHIPGRTTDFLDFISSLAGITIALFIIYARNQKK